MARTFIELHAPNDGAAGYVDLDEIVYIGHGYIDRSCTVLGLRSGERVAARESAEDIAWVLHQLSAEVMRLHIRVAPADAATAPVE